MALQLFPFPPFPFFRLTQGIAFRGNPCTSLWWFPAFLARFHPSWQQTVWRHSSYEGRREGAASEEAFLEQQAFVEQEPLPEKEEETCHEP